MPIVAVYRLASSPEIQRQPSTNTTTDCVAEVWALPAEQFTALEKLTLLRIATCDQPATELQLAEHSGCSQFTSDQQRTARTIGQHRKLVRKVMWTLFARGFVYLARVQPDGTLTWIGGAQ